MFPMAVLPDFRLLPGVKSVPGKGLEKAQKKGRTSLGRGRERNPFPEENVKLFQLVNAKNGVGNSRQYRERK